MSVFLKNEFNWCLVCIWCRHYTHRRLPPPPSCPFVCPLTAGIGSSRDHQGYGGQSLTLTDVCSSVQQFENMLRGFRLQTDVKKDSCERPPTPAEEEPWRITDQDVERNRIKVLHKHTLGIMQHMGTLRRRINSLWDSVPPADPSERGAAEQLQRCCADYYVSR